MAPYKAPLHPTFHATVNQWVADHGIVGPNGTTWPYCTQKNGKAALLQVCKECHPEKNDKKVDKCVEHAFRNAIGVNRGPQHTNKAFQRGHLGQSLEAVKKRCNSKESTKKKQRDRQNVQRTTEAGEEREKRARTSEAGKENVKRCRLRARQKCAENKTARVATFAQFLEKSIVVATLLPADANGNLLKCIVDTDLPSIRAPDLLRLARHLQHWSLTTQDQLLPVDLSQCDHLQKCVGSVLNVFKGKKEHSRTGVWASPYTLQGGVDFVLRHKKEVAFLTASVTHWLTCLSFFSG